MPWIQAHLTTDASNAPLIELLFENLGALSVTLGDAEDHPLLEPAPGETPLWNVVRVTGLFEATQNLDQLRSQINQILKHESSRSLELEILEDQEWERVWMDSFKPMQFGRRLWICPHGQHPGANDAVVVELDPGLAFGTGTHPTTALCLEWLDSQPLAGKTIIDFGCGSGILAIAALKLGAEHVVALDHDPQALEATEQNAKNNGVRARITVTQSSEQLAAADLVVANILAGTLIELEPLLAQLTRADGSVALSGILQEQTEGVLAAFESDYTMAEPEQKQEWMLLTGSRKG